MGKNILRGQVVKKSRQASFRSRVGICRTTRPRFSGRGRIGRNPDRDRSWIAEGSAGRRVRIEFESKRFSTVARFVLIGFVRRRDRYDRPARMRRHKRPEGLDFVGRGVSLEKDRDDIKARSDSSRVGFESPLSSRDSRAGGFGIGLRRGSRTAWALGCRAKAGWPKDRRRQESFRNGIASSRRA